MSPEIIQIIAKASVEVVSIITASVVGVFTTYLTLKNRRDLHIAHDRIREIKGEPLQYRYNSEKRKGALPVKGAKNE